MLCTAKVELALGPALNSTFYHFNWPERILKSQIFYLGCNCCMQSIKLLITFCMKLPWFCQTNSGQLFCNCPLFVIALSRPLFWRETSQDLLSFCRCFKMAENSVSLLCRMKILQLKHKHTLLRAWQFSV